MASTKFVARVQDAELIRKFFDIVGVEGDRLIEATVNRSHDGYSPFNVTVSYETRLDGEDEDSTLSDYYEVDDYDIVPFDWGGDTSEINLEWRRWMFGQFGEEYAEWYLLGRLEESIKYASKWSLGE